MENDVFDVLGVKVSAVNLNKAFTLISEWVENKVKSYVCVAPVSTIISCQENKDYKNIVNNASMVTPDGMPLVWIAKSQGYGQVSRTYGPDLMLEVCGRGQDKGFRHYLLGGTEHVNEMLETALRKRFPDINIAGRFSPPFSDELQEDMNLIDMVNDANPDILWVGLGSPKQDFWMSQHRDRIMAPVMIGVGAAFDFLAGVKPQAPLWMQRWGLEWIFRLCCEPKRLWKRYLIGNSKFIWLLAMQGLRSKD